MSNVRAVFFLAAQKRVDARRKTGKNVKCKAPNKQCGRRCIPPEWDCRIKGEGHDNHQRASNFDPLSGAANVQRGVKRVAKGVVTGNVSEVEGGTRAIKRGIVKSIPGDVEKKKKVRESLDKNTRTITIGLALVTGGFALHNVMKRGWPAYADGVGRRLDDSVRAGVSAVMDRVPGLGGIRAQQRNAAEGAALRTYSRISQNQAAGPDALTEQAEQVPGTVLRGGIATRGRSSVTAAMAGVDDTTRANANPFDDWKRDSREAMWNTRVGTHSVFSDDATYHFLAQQHGLAGNRSGSIEQDMNFIQTHVAGSLSVQSQQLRRDAINQGFNINARGRGGTARRTTARTAYINQTIRQNFPGAPVQFQNQLRAELDNLLSRPDGHDFRPDAARVVRETRAQFDSHFRAIADFASVTPGDRVRPEQRDLVEHMNIGHAQALHRRFPGNLRNEPIAGPTHAEFTQRYAYDIRVMGRPVTDVTRRVLLGAASDIAGQPFTDVEAARAFLRTRGYTRLSQASPPAPPRTPRGDSAERSPIYMATYLQQLRRFDAGLGKPCGESYIPKAHKCGKQSVLGSAGRTEAFADKHDAKYKAKAMGSFFARVGLTAGAGILAYKSGQELLSGKSVNTSAPIGFALIAGLGVASLIREQKVTKSPEQLAAELQDLKRAKGVEPETLDKLSKFVTDSQIDVRRVGTMQILAGMAGYFDTAKPDRLHTVGGFASNDRTYKSKDSVDALDNGLKRFMEDRAALSPHKQDARNITDIKEFRRNFAASGYVGNDKGVVTAITIHELGHALHYRGDFATPKSVKVDGKEYSGAELQAELIRSSSIYGQSDVRRAIKPQPGNYYQQGNRLETFTENFVLFTANGKNMKETFPVSYAWTKATMDYALTKPAKKPARPFADVLGDLAEGTERFNPDKVLPKKKAVAKKDSTDDDRFFALYNEMQTAANAGDILGSIKVLAQAQLLPKEQKQMIAALMETASMYHLIGKK